MPGRRPTAVTVMAILNIVFGSLFNLFYVCCGILLLVFVNDRSMLAVAGVNVFADQWEFMARELPSYPVVFIGSFALSLVLNTALLVSGIGLLNMRGWARLMAIVYAVVTIVYQIGGVVYALAYSIPTLHRWNEDFHRRLNLPPGSAGGGPGNEILSVFVGVLIAVYAIILLVMMFKPNVRAAFAGLPLDDYRGPDPLDRWEDRYDRGGDRNPWGY